MNRPSQGAAADGDTCRDAGPQRLRRALGHFASGVTVVTTTSGGPERPQAHGMTANAFTSVSLEPPLVLVSISEQARTHERIARTGRYGVSILRGEQESLSYHFAGGAQSPELPRFVWRDGLPLLAGALVHLSCRVRQTHRAGDHTLFIGEVEGLWCGSGAPLVHYRRGLHTLAVDPADPETGVPRTTVAPTDTAQTGRPIHVR
ncbi:flavin reductase family protein [Streptomyces coerulescens]|uniref:Flavin reductase family protein n=1 Tax=Streptomyces coerulescens TaxID=29304 RepID=A0ABW0CJ80_STRCD